MAASSSWTSAGSARINLNEKTSISIIDFTPFLPTTQAKSAPQVNMEKQTVADSLLASFKETGFVYLMNHGISQDKIDTMFDWTKKFFAQPLTTKQLAPHPASGAHHRGYSAPGVEKVTQHVYDASSLAKERSDAPDVKESYECGREGDETMPNIWLPEGVLPGFREACLDFFWTCYEVELTILRALALGFHLPEDYFLATHTAPDNQLRLLHYPSVPLSALADSSLSRINAHSDFGSITLLLQDDVGGLEVEDPQAKGAFRPVPPVPGALIVNAGDFLMRWSNDTIRSTIHRVRAPPGFSDTNENGMTPERYSIPYFCCVDFDTIVDAVPGTYSDDPKSGMPKKYEPISAREYIMKRLAASY